MSQQPDTTGNRALPDKRWPSHALRQRSYGYCRTNNDRHGETTHKRPDNVWCTDITYVPMPCGHAYLCAVMDWASRKVVGWAV